MPNVLTRKLEGFGPLSLPDKRLLEEIVTARRRIVRDHDIVSEGDPPNDVHFIVSGLAFRYKALEDGHRQIMAFMLPGDICDLQAILLRSMDHCIGVADDVEVATLPRAQVLKLLESPAIARALLMTTMVDAATLREWIVNIGSRSAQRRLAHLFCEMHLRMDAIGLVQDDGYALPLSQTDLGDTLGLSSVHVNRSLQQIRARGLVVFSGGRLSIPDVPRLQAMSGFRSNYLHLGAAWQSFGPRPPRLSS